MEELLQKWNEIKEYMRREYGIMDISYKTWILPLNVHSVDNNIVTIVIPNEIAKGMGVDLIKNKFGMLFKVCISDIMNHEYDVQFISEANINNANSSYNNSDSLDNNYLANTNKARAEKANLNSKYTFDTFVVGENSRFAQSAALAVSETPGEVYNPLFIWGGAGLGKTHLMHSIGHFIIENYPDKNVLYVTSELFTNEIIEAIRSGNQEMNKIREKYRNIDVLLLDDVQFIIGKKSTQEEFFHTFNDLHSAGKAIIISSDKPPKDMETLEERLRSRFEWGLIADIQPPDYETRMAILRKNAETRGFDVGDDILNYIATNIKSNIRELEGAFNKVIALSNMNRDERITISTAEEAIKDIVSPIENKKITPSIVLEKVSSYYNVSMDDILSKKRNQEIVTPRHVVMYLCNEVTDSNIVSIGKFLGNRDHSTVLHGIKKIENDLNSDEILLNSIENIKKLLDPSIFSTD